MWKRLYFVTVVLCFGFGVSKLTPENVTGEILGRLGLTLDYVSRNYDKINVDCLFGVVLAGAILDDVRAAAGPYQSRVQDLKAKTREIYAKTMPLMRKQPQWDYFARHIVTPALWQKPLKYKLSEFRMSYAMKSRVEALFSMKTYENITEGFTDQCLSSVINVTMDLKPKTICRLSPKCEKFVEGLEKGSGYILTHKLLLLQVARARKCKMHPKILANAIKKVCTTIYTETISAEYFVSLDEIFDLFLEQTLLCGYEGYADFLKLPWLEKVFEMQHDTGCFPVGFAQRSKRETNEWADGCADHTTGLGTGVLSLYLNYIIKHSDTVMLTSEWF